MQARRNCVTVDPQTGERVVTQLNTEYNRQHESTAQPAAPVSPDWFRWECQGHIDFVAIQVNMLKRLAEQRRLRFGDTGRD